MEYAYIKYSGLINMFIQAYTQDISGGFAALKKNILQNSKKVKPQNKNVKKPGKIPTFIFLLF